MGWTSSPSWTTKAELVAELRSQVRSYVIVDEHIGRNVWFLLEQPSGERFIVLFLTEGGAGGWAYKDVTEDMGPCEVDCPLRLIEAAGPIESQYANEWRDRVRAYWQTKVARMAQVIEPGVKVTVYGSLTRSSSPPILAVRGSSRTPPASGTRPARRRWWSCRRWCRSDRPQDPG